MQDQLNMLDTLKMKHQVSVVIVDDERAIQERLSPHLIDQGYQVSAFSNGKMALDNLRNNPPDIIILDIMMPTMDGIGFCKQWRPLHPQTIIIFLSSIDNEESLLSALLSGGDDYLTKPFSINELLVRIEVCVRRLRLNSPKAVNKPTCGLSMDEESWSASIDETDLVLTVSEFRILYKLYKSPGRVYTREQLIQAAYSEDAYISDRNADAHIKRIRKKLAAAHCQDTLIETVYGVGYRFKK